MSAGLLPDSVHLVKSALQAAMPDTFAQFFDGDPGMIAEHDLPAVVVEQVRDRLERASVAEHDAYDTIQVAVVFNKKDDYEGEVDVSNLTHRRILDAIGARDAETGRFLPTTVKGVLARGIDGDQRIAKTITTEIGLNPRAGGMVTAEGRVRFDIQTSIYTDTN